VYRYGKYIALAFLLISVLRLLFGNGLMHG
jgi:hypothetical protein